MKTSQQDHMVYYVEPFVMPLITFAGMIMCIWLFEYKISGHCDNPYNDSAL